LSEVLGSHIGIIGAGRLGTALAKALVLSGHDVVGIAARSVASRERAAHAVPDVAVREPCELARDTDLLFVTVADDAIGPVVSQLVSCEAIRADQYVAHLSGRCGLAVLQEATARGAAPFALHPAMTFAGTDDDYTRFAGLPFGITALPQYRGEAERITRSLGGVPIWVPEADRVLYHAALCFGANNLITLVAAAVQALAASSVDNPRMLIEPLLSVSLANALQFGDEALTGPVRRADVGTIRSHLEAFEKAVPELLGAYRDFGRFTAQRAITAKLNDAAALERSIAALDTPTSPTTAG
jgi:predicted short-subunit dehydrogenase-like oxidoreductase (DUF2520 family)